MDYLSHSPVIGLSIVGLGQVVITIQEVLVGLMKEIINHLTTEVIMTLEDHTVLNIVIVEDLDAPLVCTNLHTLKRREGLSV